MVNPISYGLTKWSNLLCVDSAVADYSTSVCIWYWLCFFRYFGLAFGALPLSRLSSPRLTMFLDASSFHFYAFLPFSKLWWTAPGVQISWSLVANITPFFTFLWLRSYFRSSLVRLSMPFLLDVSGSRVWRCSLLFFPCLRVEFPWARKSSNLPRPLSPLVYIRSMASMHRARLAFFCCWLFG